MRNLFLTHAEEGGGGKKERWQKAGTKKKNCAIIELFIEQKNV